MCVRDGGRQRQEEDILINSLPGCLHFAGLHPRPVPSVQPHCTDRHTVHYDLSLQPSNRLQINSWGLHHATWVLPCHHRVWHALAWAPKPPGFSCLSPGHQHLPVAPARKGEVRQERLHEPGRVGAAGGADPVSGVQHREQRQLRRDEVLCEWDTPRQASGGTWGRTSAALSQVRGALQPQQSGWGNTAVLSLSFS